MLIKAISDLLNNESFQVSFWGNFLSDIVVVLALSFLFPYYYFLWYKKPNIKIFNRKNRKEVVELSHISGAFKATTQLIVENKGNEGFKDWYWHFLIPQELNPDFISNPSGNIQNPIKEEIVDLDGNRWWHFHERLLMPIFAHSNLIFPYSLELETSTRKDFEVFWSLNTELGSYPSKAKDINDQSSIGDLRKKWGKILVK